MNDQTEPGGQPERMTLGSFLAQARQEAGIGRRQLASMSGVGRMTIQRLEADYYREPSPDDLVRIAHALELNETDLFLLAGIPVPKKTASLEVMLRTGYGVSSKEVPELKRQIEALIAQHAKPSDPPPLLQATKQQPEGGAHDQHT
jgi:transcriptional regulator with XRE-family HTH domain